MAVLTPASVFRQFVTDGVPSSGKHKPEKAEIIQLLNTLFGTSRGGWVVAGTKAELDGVTPENETDGGVVLDDPTASNNGYYQRDASAWVKGRGFPDTFAVMTQTGGTANALQVSVADGVNPGDVVGALLVPDATNSAGGTSLLIGGASGVPLLSAAGAELAAGELVAGKATLIAKIEGDWRVILAYSQFSFRKAWSSEAAYVADDMVEREGSIWLALRPNTNVEPSEGADWTLFLPGVSVADGAVTTPKLANKAVEFGKINYLTLYGPKPLEYFNSSSTVVGSDNTSVDRAALQAALNTEYAVDIAGLKLKLDDTITITKQEAMLMSSIPSQRNGSGDAVRSANIEVVDDLLPVLFEVNTYNARFQGFRVRCGDTNTTTSIIHAIRSDTHQADVDMSVKDMTLEYGNRGVHIQGRGLQMNDCEVVGLKDAAISLDWDPDWIPSARSNDQIGTAERAYTITQIRQHGCRALVTNTGDHRKYISDILISDIQGDTGGCIFEGVLKHSLINNVQSHFHPVSQDQFNLYGGSRHSRITNFMLTGFISNDTTRTPSLPIRLGPDNGADNSIFDVTFAHGTIGPCKSYAVQALGGGVLDVVFDDVEFIDTAYNSGANVVFVLSQPGDLSKTIEDYNLTLNICRFRQTFAPLTAKAAIVGGTNTSLTKARRNHLSRQVGMSVPWVNGSIQDITS